MFPRQMKISVVVAALLAVTACSNGGSGGSSSDRGSNSGPSLQLDDGEVLGGSSSVIRIPAGDDTGIARVGNRILRQGALPECAAQFADNSLVVNTLIEACISDQPACAVTFQPLSNQIEVIPPPLYAPIGLEYEITLVDRDGSATDPVKAVFCFDVGTNTPPAPTADTFQVTYGGQIVRSGVRYDERCAKLDGSQGVLANDEDDEHITNECLTAELLELPRFASNLSTFGNSFRADGGFVYEAFGVPPEGADGRTVDSFTYRVSDGVNPPSAPIKVDIIFTNDNQPPTAADDRYSVLEDSTAQSFTVLDNDIDPDALPLLITSINNGPGNGVANIRNGVVIEYRPNAEFVGEDRFGYTAVDSGGLSVNANVIVTVTGVNDAPLAQNDAASTNRNVPVEIRVRDNDSDPEGDAITVASVAQPLHGTTQVTASGNVLYTPEFNFSGPDSFEYTISDGADTATGTVVMQVVFVNVAPTAVSDDLFLSEGESGEFNLLTNDSDGDGDSLSIISVSDPQFGTAVLVSGGSVRYTPAPGYNGSDSFSYTVSDGSVEAIGQVNVSISAVNDSPVAVDDTAATSEGSAIDINLVDNDTDPDGDSLSISNVTDPSVGTVFVRADGRSVTYTPAANFSGNASFGYTVDDGNGATSSARVTVSVSAVNETPIALDDFASTAEDQATVIDVLANDSDPDGDRLAIAIVNGASNGVAELASNAIRYTPAAGFVGSDSFTYSISDAAGLSAQATVSITVDNTNDAPQAGDDTAATSENAAIAINVLSNDTDADGDQLALAVTSVPSNGVASVQGGSILFTPATGFSGTDQFTYSVTDPSGASDSATVTVTVSNVNQPPVATDDTRATEENDPVSINVLANDSDPDGGALQLSVVSQPSNGRAAVNAQGTRIVYSPVNGFSGTDSFIYQISDSDGATDTASVTVTVSSVNAAPTAVNDLLSTLQDQPISIDVLANDTDPDGDALTITAITTASSGVATISGNTISYTPNAGFSGTDAFSYTVSDGDGATSGASVTVTVTAVFVNSPPVALDDSASTLQATTVVIPVLVNDSDPDGHALVVSIASAPSNGAVNLLASGQIEYTPGATFSGTDSFVYLVDDGNGASDTATVTIEVTAVVTNQAPVAVNDSAVTDQDVALTIDVLANDSDPDSDVLTVGSVGPAANGTAVVSAAGVLYTPSLGFFGVDTFNYTITDPDGAASTAVVAVTVNAPVVTNVLPVAVDDAGTTDVDVPLVISVLLNDSDADGDALTVTAVGAPSNGGAVVNADNTVSYTPAAGYVGGDSFSYTISDGVSGTATAMVDVLMLGAPGPASSNSIPVAVDDTATMRSGSTARIRVLDNDSDADGDPLSLSTGTLPVNGTLRVHNNGKWLIYTPAAGFVGSDSFGYWINDGKGGTDSAVVTVEVN